MAQYINKDDLVAKIIKLDGLNCLESPTISHNEDYKCGYSQALEKVRDFIDTLEVKEVDLEKESESIANGIMISVQSNKYGTNIYNAKRNDFNHYHLQMAARKGIELGLKVQKGK